MNESESAYVNLALAHLRMGGLAILSVINYVYSQHFCTVLVVEVLETLENLALNLP